MENQNGPAAVYEQPAPPSTPPKKVRRVGTVAFALVLIAVGVLMLAAILLPRFDPRPVLRFAPAVLIVLGVEVLVYAVQPDVVLKYDFLSMFACAFILVVVGGASLVPMFWRYYDPENELQRRHIAAELEQTANEAMDADHKGAVLTMEFMIRENTMYSGQVSTAADLKPGDCTGHVTLAGPYSDTTAFAADCQRLLQTWEALPAMEYNFSVVQNEADAQHHYMLSVDALWGRDADPAALAGTVDDWWEDDDCVYSSYEQMEEVRRAATAETAEW